jgi:hypothetical protein
VVYVPAAGVEFAKIEAWAKNQPDEPNRSEGIRRLVDLGLKGKK